MTELKSFFQLQQIVVFSTSANNFLLRQIVLFLTFSSKLVQ